MNNKNVNKLNHLELIHCTEDVPDGQFITVWRDRYWQTTDNGEPQFFGNSPMCNANKTIAEKLGAHTFMPIVWAKATLSEYYNDDGEFCGTDWYYPDLKNSR